jgi:hypothetical protein
MGRNKGEERSKKEVMKKKGRKVKMYGGIKQTTENGCEMWLRNTN